MIGGGKHTLLLSIIRMYAPTFHSPQQEKDHFYADLQSILDAIPDEDVLVVLGDWNARLGSNQGNEECDSGILDRHL